MIRHVLCDQDAATNIIIAAMKTSEQHWLRELPEWAPETTEEYTANALTKDMTKKSDDEIYQLKNNLES